MNRIVEVGPEIFELVFKRNIDVEVHYISPHDIAMWDVYVMLIKKAQEANEIGNTMPAENLVEAIVHLSNGIGIIWCNKKGDFDYIKECKKMIETLLLVNT